VKYATNVGYVRREQFLNLNCDVPLIMKFARTATKRAMLRMTGPASASVKGYLVNEKK